MWVQIGFKYVRGHTVLCLMDTHHLIYRDEDRFGVKGQALEKAEWSLEALMCVIITRYYTTTV